MEDRNSNISDSSEIENDNNATTTTKESFEWTYLTVFQALVVFIVSGFAEIIGGWLIWKAIRSNNDGTTKPWWWAVIGSVVVIVYGFLPTLQPTDSFGRIYAVYGGFFIVLSFLLGWYLDGDRPDRYVCFFVRLLYFRQIYYLQID